MPMHAWTVASTSFIASAVEMVEALTIVLAVAYTSGWRPALQGTIAALVALGVLVAIGVPILHLVPENWIKVIVGAFLIWFGWGWLKKAILRAAGRKAQRDETAIYTAELQRLKSAQDSRIGVATAFNGVFLEGLEVALIVLAIAGASLTSLRWAVIGATAALVIVVAAGVVLHAPLSKVPENAMKFVVGVMLTSLGVYWLGAGLRVAWPGDEAAILWLAATVLIASLIAVRVLSASAAPARRS